MKKNNKHTDIYTHLTLDELLEYTKGVLGNDEMYRLELHLNECELCSDALEGVENIKQPEQLIESINTQIVPESKNKRGTNYLAIAASISLIAVFSLSYWLFSGSNEDNPIALNIPAESDIIIAKEDKLKEQAVELVPEIIKEESEVDISDSNDETKSSKLIEPEAQLVLEQPPKSRTENATNFSKEENLETSSIDSSKIELADSDDQLEEVVVESEISGQEMALEPAPIAARSAKKSSSDTKLTLTDQKEPIPIGGMSALKAYISNNLIYPQQAIDNKIKGTVVLEVTIAEDGSIKNMVANKKVGFGCDVEAMRLVSSGPKWTPAVIGGQPVESKQQVKVKFKN